MTLYSLIQLLRDIDSPLPFAHSCCPMKDFIMPVLSNFRLVSLFVLATILTPSYVLAQDNAPTIVEEGSVVTPVIDDLSGFDTAPDIAPADEMDMILNEQISNNGSDSFFDADDLVPQGEMGQKGPINVNPVTQPASKFIIVRSSHLNTDKKSVRLVSAERAMSLGRFASAVTMFDDLYELNKNDARVLMGRAVSLQNVGRFDEAMQMYEELSKIEPDNIDAKVNMLGLLGTRYPSIALRRLLDLHKSNKSNVVLTAQIAIAYAKTGDAASALRYLGMAASMEPDNANHVFNMAVISDKAGDEKKAAYYYEKALELDTVHGAGRSIPRDMVYERLAQIR